MEGGKPSHQKLSLRLDQVRSRSELRQLAGDASAPAQGRRFLESVCSQLTDDVLDVLRLLSSELVANALWHGAGDPLLDVQVDENQVTVGVTDSGEGEPAIATEWRWPETGHGLRLVDALSDRWGVEKLVDAPGKRVWFELSLR